MYTEEYIASLPYRPCAGIMLLNAHNNVFVGQRCDMRTEAWQMPQGGIDEGEEPHSAAMRELLEEVGTNKASLITEASDWLYYDLPAYLVPEIWKGRYRGQKQKWFLMRFEGQDSDINIATEHQEFRAWQWVRPERLPELIIPFKRKLYEQLVEEFADHLQR
jgi:putative (di)nucleoside polyphosphate hydrolase